MDRQSKDFYYLSVAEAVAAQSTCLSKKYGSIIVKDDVIVSTGYNGAPRGRINCCDRGICYRAEHNIPRGTRYEFCRAVHSESNAIIAASRESMKNATMYVYGYDTRIKGPVVNVNSCLMCKRMIINAGIERVVFADPDIGVPAKHGRYHAKSIMVQEWIDNDDSLDPEATY